MNLLFVANFARDVGYAWGTIDHVYRRVGEALRPAGVRTLLCYPEIAPGDLESAGSPTLLRFDYSRTRRSPAALWAFLRLLRHHRVGVLYLTDQDTWSWRYPLFHLAGVRRIVVHDRTSGTRAPRARVLGVLKRLLHRVPLVAADCCIGVSEFVVRRLITVNGTSPWKTHLVYNGIDVTRFSGIADGALHALLGLPPETRVVFAFGRAQPYKGIEVFIDAAARLAERGVRDVAFVYCGDGPALEAFRAHAARRGVANVHFLGRRDDVPRLLRSATVAVVPSVWAEAFGLTVVEAMAAGVPVVASAVGGIPEIVVDGATGLLVPSGDAAALADAVARLLADEPLRASLAGRAAEVVRQRFSVDHTVTGLVDVLRRYASPRYSAS